MYLLLKFNDNWADEFDVEGFIALPKKEWQEYKTKLKTLFDSYKRNIFFGFGTNQDIEYANTEEFFKHFKEIPISEEQYSFLLMNFNKKYHKYDKNDKLIGGKTIVEFGMVPYFDDQTLEDMKKDFEADLKE